MFLYSLLPAILPPTAVGLTKISKGACLEPIISQSHRLAYMGGRNKLNRELPLMSQTYHSVKNEKNGLHFRSLFFVLSHLC